MSDLRTLCATAIACCVLAGCGGGGGSGSSPGGPTLPPPPPPPPPQVNTSMDSIVYSQTFTNDAAVGHAVIDTVGGASAGEGETLSATAQSTTLEIKFDAATGAYTLTSLGISQTFTPADAAPDDGSGFDSYEKVGPAGADYLSLDARPLQRYVRMGFWQHNQPAPAGQADITFTPFAYGLETPSSAMPRTGQAGYAVDLFGFFTPEGSAPKVVEGAGEFRADFLSGLFVASGEAYEYYLLVDYYTGPHHWTSSGRITSDGGISGPFVYEVPYGNSAIGELQGQFYGPNGEEIGGAVAAATPTGGSLSAALTGRRSSSVIPRDLSNVQNSPFDLPTLQAPITRVTFADGTSSTIVGYGQDVGRFTRDAQGRYTLRLDSPLPGGPTGVFAQSDRVAAKSDNRATVYEKGAERLTIYNPRHPDLDLTYTSFGLWQSSGGATSPALDRSDRIYFAYSSLPTGPDAMGRTGTAQYAAKLFGWGVNLVDSREYDVSGEMTLGIDLATMKFDGTLHAVGADVASGPSRDFGSFTFAGDMSGSGYRAYFATNPANTSGGVDGRLYGPRGEETAARFEIITRDAGLFPYEFVQGLAIGKRQ